MRKFVLPLAALLALGLVGKFSFAADTAKDTDKDKKDHKFNGVLIDNNCGEKSLKKDDPQKDAAGHSKACAVKCGKTAGYAIMSHKKLLKFDDEGNKKAAEYFDKHESTKVVVMGTKDGEDKIKVDSIEERKEKKEGKSDSSDKHEHEAAK